MALLQSKGIHLIGSVVVLPTETTDNLDLSFLNQEAKENFIKHTGIRYRRIAKKEDRIEAYFDKGISEILDDLQWDVNEIQVLICVSQTPSTKFPSMANQLHANWKMTSSCLCFDINLGCSGFVYGLQLVSQLLNGFSEKNVKALLCCGDFSSRIIQKNDSATEPIFSDGISVTAIEKLPLFSEWFFHLESISSGVDAIKYDLDKGAMELNGIDVFQHSVQFVPKNLYSLFSFADIHQEKIDYFILHQANRLINQSIAKKLQCNIERFPSSIEQFGNTSSASIPLTLILQQNETSSGEATYCFCGFGVGFSIGSVLLKMPPLKLAKCVDF
ncbi:MAG: 3-oxoacyl-ACP synthase III family protein [Flavobacteriales bacterium]